MSKTNFSKYFLLPLFLVLSSLLIANTALGLDSQLKENELIFKEKSKNARKGFHLSFYLSGSYRFVNGGDLNTWIDHFVNKYIGTNDYVAWDKLKNVPEVNFELIYNISEFLGIGVGIGYLSKSNNGNYGWEKVDGDYNDYSHNIDLNALVLSGNFHGNIPLGKSFVLDITTGGDFYFGKYIQSHERDWYYWNIDHYALGMYEVDDDATCNTLGFHLGAALDIRISPNIAFVVGGFYKFLKFKNFFGTYNYNNKTTGYTYSYEGYLRYDPEYPYLWVSNDTQSNYRKGVIDLSGFAIQMGIRISNLFSKKK